MTREQALETLKEMAFTAYGHRSEALDMAISALSDYDKMQKISLDLAFENDELLNELDSIKNGTPLSADGDCISRQAVEEMIKAEMPERGMWEIEGDKEKETVCEVCVDLMQKLSELPSVEKWISVSERLPEELESVNITWINRNPESYYADIKDKPFTATGVYFNGQWYWWTPLCTDILAEYSHNYDAVIDDGIEIIAWQPLPEPYKAERGEQNG